MTFWSVTRKAEVLEMYQELQRKVMEDQPSYSREEIWKELHKRSPETHPDDNPSILKYSDVVPKLLENGYIKQ